MAMLLHVQDGAYANQLHSKNKWIMLTHNVGCLSSVAQTNSPMTVLNIIQLIIVLHYT